MFTVSEITTLIDNKEWDKIVQEEESLNLIIDNMSRLTITYSVVEELFLNKEYMKELLFNSDGYHDTISRKLNSHLMSVSNSIPRSFWEKWLDFALSLKPVPMMTAVFISGFYSLSEKPTEFYSAFLDRADEILAQTSVWSTDFANTIGQKEVSQLSDAHKDKLVEIIGSLPGGGKNVHFENWQTIKALTSDISVGIDVMKRTKTRSFTGGQVYRDTPLAKFEIAVVQSPSDQYNATILTWYNYNQDVKTVSDIVVDTVIKNKWPVTNIYTLANDEQILKLSEAGLVPLEIVAKNPNISLESLLEMSEGKKVDIFESGRFFTEEELIQYPNLVNPFSYISYHMGYMSKSTLEMLNELWGANLVWGEKYTDFDEIVPILQGDAITEENIRYLAGKTGTRPNNMYNAMSNISLIGVDTDKSALLKGLKVMKDLHYKYG